MEHQQHHQLGGRQKGAEKNDLHAVPQEHQEICGGLRRGRLGVVRQAAQPQGNGGVQRL